MTDLVELEGTERVIALVSFAEQAPPLAMGTAAGVVKRVAMNEPPRADVFDAITLKEGDEIVGAAHCTDDADLVFLSSDARLLRFTASSVRPQGRAAGGMSGMKLAPGTRALSFSVISPDTEAAVVTIAGARDALDNSVGGSIKVSPFDLFPRKGRATGGVRAHRFLKGEDVLIHGAVAPRPAKASDDQGRPVALPDLDDRRDGSGQPLTTPIAAIASAVPNL